MAGELPPARVPHPNVGPMALRWNWNALPPFLDATQAPACNFEYVFPLRLPNPKVGPPALRLAWRSPPFIRDQPAPAVNVEFVFPVYPATGASRVGPAPLRGGRHSYLPIPDLAAPTNQEFVFPLRVPNPFVGPMALRWNWNALPPYPGANLAAAQNFEFVFPSYPTSRTVGPQVLRQTPPFLFWAEAPTPSGISRGRSPNRVRVLTAGAAS